MWLAGAIFGIIVISTGITLLPGGSPPAPPAQSAPATPPAQNGGAGIQK